MPTEELFEDAANGRAVRNFAAEITSAWKEVLGTGAEVNTGFIANGGDSLKAVLLADRIFRLTGHEVDYLEVLDAPDAATLTRAIPDGRG
ncbi:phosphopantetheine-binding protein [Saccharothrix lopnurensis]|uniref:Phosphopantetheine-binding protein n=1 Tax=Saccharothrix lopnurensis TaxID=1670621 RepID=A0ABW1PAN0_9PSEU